MKIFFLIILFCSAVFAQEKLQLDNASKIYDVRVTVDSCRNGSSEGKLKVELFTKTGRKPFQTFNLGATAFSIDEVEMVNTKMLYDSQSIVFLEDYNFDGMEDLAIRDGNNGGYGGPSYQVYLFSPRSKKFVHNYALTDLNQGSYLGAMEVDKKKKVLQTLSKSGCCWHQTEEFAVVNDRPKKVFEETEDATVADEAKVKITTKKLVKGRWRTMVKYTAR